MLGGMPVAVSAGLAYPRWREMSRQEAPLPTDRILMVDVRNLDPPEEQLVRATDVVIAAPAPGFPGEDLEQAVRDLADRCDLIYLHVDSDILDERYVPNHRTKEPNGPSMEQVLAAIDTVMATGKVVTYAMVSIWADGDGGDVAVDSGVKLIAGGLESWRRHGIAEPASASLIVPSLLRNPSSPTLLPLAPSERGEGSRWSEHGSPSPAHGPGTRVVGERVGGEGRWRLGLRAVNW